MSIFQTREYLELFSHHFINDKSTLFDSLFEILPDKKAVLLGMKPVLNNQEITDFGDLENPTVDMVRNYIDRLKIERGVNSIQFDYIRESSKLYQILSEVCPDPPTLQEVSPYIMLPSSWDLYLESLERTDRKELKRKIKRLDTVEHSFQIFDKSKAHDVFETFITLHKLSDHAKDKFMTEPMKAFFKDLLVSDIPGWSQKLAFLDIVDKPAAAVLYFESETEILLYNSGYDPEQKFYSVGLLLVADVIKKAIEAKKQKFDFLRGNERYKYDLGGKDETLFRFLLH